MLKPLLLCLLVSCNALPSSYNPYVEYGTISNGRGPEYEVVTFGFSPSWKTLERSQEAAFALMGSDKAKQAIQNLANLEVSRSGTLTLEHDDHTSDATPVEKEETDKTIEYAIYAMLIGFVGLVATLIGKVTNNIKKKKEED